MTICSSQLTILQLVVVLQKSPGIKGSEGTPKSICHFFTFYYVNRIYSELDIVDVVIFEAFGFHLDALPCWKTRATCAESSKH